MASESSTAVTSSSSSEAGASADITISTEESCIDLRNARTFEDMIAMITDRNIETKAKFLKLVKEIFSCKLPRYQRNVAVKTLLSRLPHLAIQKRRARGKNPRVNNNAQLEEACETQKGKKDEVETSTTVREKCRGRSGVQSIPTGVGRPFFYDSIYLWLFPCIMGYQNVTDDGNCGYRCVANIVKGDQSKWDEVRSELVRELQLYGRLYANIHGFPNVTSMIQNLCWWSHEENVPDDKRMTLEDVGFVIANKYNAVVVALRDRNSRTFLPTHCRAGVSEVAHEIWILYYAPMRRFVSLTLSDDSPLPPIDIKWRYHIDVSVAHLEGLLASRIQQWYFSVGARPVDGINFLFTD